MQLSFFQFANTGARPRRHMVIHLSEIGRDGEMNFATFYLA